MKQVRKTLAFLLLLALTLGGCGGKTAGSAPPLYQRGLEVVALMDEMAGSDAYGMLFTESPEIGAVAKTLGGGRHAEPKEVYRITFSDEKLLFVLSEAGGPDSLDGFSDGLQKLLRQRMAGSLVTQINAMSGTANLAAASIYSVQTSFVSDELDQSVLYVYVYEDAVPAAVLFTAGEGGAVNASGSFLLNDGLSADPGQTLENLFGAAGAAVEPVSGR